MTRTNRLQPKHVVTIVLAVCFAAVMTPIAVGAVAPQKVSIFDSGGTRAVRVSASHALEVDARHGGAVQRVATATQTTVGTSARLVDLGPSKTLNITELTISGASTGTGLIYVQLVKFVRFSGTSSCLAVEGSPSPSGFIMYELHRVVFPETGAVVPITFADQPLSIVTGAAPLTCLAVRLALGPAGTTVVASLVGYDN